MKKLLAGAFFGLVFASAALAQSTGPTAFGLFPTGVSPWPPIWMSMSKTPGGNWNNLETCRPADYTNQNDPCYNWGGMDAGIARNESHAVDSVYVFIGVPGWANGNAGLTVPPTDPNDFYHFVTAMATRYKGQMKVYETWNEINETSWWSGTVAQMATMSANVCSIIHSIDPSATVVSPSFYNFSGIEYMPAFYALGGGSCVDAIGLHSYPIFYLHPAQPEQIWNYGPYLTALAQSYGFAGKPVIASEGGYFASGNPLVANYDNAAQGEIWPLMMSCIASRAMPYGYDDTVDVGAEMWGGSGRLLNARGTGYKTMLGWLIGNTITQCPTRTPGTNTIRNPNGTGFAAGTPGTPPTNWTLTNPDSGHGISTQIVGSCTNGGTTGVVWRVFGTETTGGAGYNLMAMEAATQVSASYQQTWTYGATISLVGGSMTNVSQTSLQWTEYNSGGSNLSNTLNSANSGFVPLSYPAANAWPAATVSATVSYLIPGVVVQYTVGNPIDLTLCISNATMDTGSIWTATLSGVNGYLAEIAWDATGGPTTFTVPGSYTSSRNWANDVAPLGATVTLNARPLLLENAQWKGLLQ